MCWRLLNTQEQKQQNLLGGRGGGGAGVGPNHHDGMFSTCWDETGKGRRSHWTINAPASYPSQASIAFISKTNTLKSILKARNLPLF